MGPGFRFSFRRYSLYFILGVGLLYLLLSVLGYHFYGVAKLDIEHTERAAARIELQTVFGRAMDDLRQGADRLAEWDELYQQLANPEYFSYWYGHRIRGGQGLDPRFTDLMLYSPDGRALSLIKDSRLPARLDLTDLQVSYLPRGDDIEVQIIRPLHRERDSRMGFVAVRASLRANIVRLQSFNRIDVHQLRFALDQPTHDPQQVLRAIRYQLQPTPAQAAMDRLVLHLILLLSLAVLLPTLLLSFFLIRVVGRAVMRIPQMVNTLRTRGLEAAQEQIDHEEGWQVAELETVQRLLIDYHRELSSANASLDQKNQELWNLAHRDVLTGAHNRRAFDNFWQTLQSLKQRQRMRSLRLMLCDVNHFKAINDTYGHDIGDAVLQAIVACLHRAVRRDEQLFRLGGDEFACILIDCDDQQAMAVASRCEHEVANYPFAEKLGIREPVRLSIGISPVAEDTDTPAKVLLRQADVAMYHSKRPSSGSVCIYRESLESRSGTIFSNSINEAVYRVIEQGEGLVMHYQPIRRAEDDSVAYYEALMRIGYGDQLVYPDEILPLVESRHLERELDQAVIDQLLKDFYASKIPSGSGVAINLSAASIIDSNILARLDAFRPFMSDYRLVLEVTETTLITQMELATTHLMHLRNQGFQIALDDFGSGYSSLSYLTGMPVDIVKFDITLVRALHDAAHRRLVGHLLEFIASVGQATVAEGVEDAAILEQVREIGFDYVQGFYKGRPAPLEPVRRITN